MTSTVAATASPSRRPDVSVVLPTRNRAALLPRALASVLAQEGVGCPSFEVILVDDGSTDGTANVLAGVQDKRVRILPPRRHGGAGAARNAGVRAARADWVAFQDDDDEWMPGKLAAQWQARNASPGCVMVYSDMMRVAPDGQTRPFPAPPPPTGTLGPHDWAPLGIGLQSCLISKAAIARIGGFDEELPRFIDLDLFLRLRPLGSFLHLATPLVRYHETPGISSNPLAAAAARRRLLAKHGAGFQRQHLAWHEHMIGVLACAGGDLVGGRQNLWRAWRLAPWRPTFLAVAILASTPRLFAAAQRRERRRLEADRP